jgi:aarF domain-containing kinase
LHIAELLSNLLTIVSTHRVLLEPNFTSVVLALMLLEGLGRSLDPELDLLTVARPFILHLQ